MKWIGLTGGIATGKSTVKKLILSRGVSVIDADEISHKITAINEIGYKSVVSHFGNIVLNSDMSLNRKKLGEIVFNNVEQRLQLEKILHPLIQVEVSKLKKSFEQKMEKVTFYDIPLLFEASNQAEFDAVVVVWCDPEIQKKRLMLRNGLTESEALYRIQAQWPLTEKVKLASHCLDNSTDEEALQLQVNNLLAQF